MGYIATTLSSRNLGALLSSTEAPSSTSRVKNVETCQVIKLRSGKECEGSTSRNNHSNEELLAQENSQDEEESIEEPS